MYTVTFYSFKGGVGRTMALVNAAFELSKLGRRVLLVDFDLEAPGVNTYTSCEKSDRLGVVDYVDAFIRTGTAPAIGDYLVQCKPSSKSDAMFWLMNSGRGGADYGRKLASINWNRLYAEQNGFLLFENLKKQWEELLHPDYVFIDSRTGYSEEGGICTRQLPDAVVVLFFLNDQNLNGVRKVVRDIRGEEVRSGKTISLHFVASNVPDLDDEDDVISDALNRFSSELSAPELSVIHHYDSLDLVQQKLFTADRPRTRLANEYRALVTKIREMNVEDREGALSSLARMVADGGNRTKLPSVQARIDQITFHHGGDRDVLVSIASVWEHFNAWDKALPALTRAIELGAESAEIYRRRAIVNRQLGKTEEARADMIAAVRSPDAGVVDLMVAIQAMNNDVPRLYVALEEILLSARLERFRPEEQALLGSELMTDPQLVPLAIRVNSELAKKPRYEQFAKTQVVLCLIHLRRYKEAMVTLGERAELSSLVDRFNYAMAEWGETGKVPRDLLRAVAATAQSEQGSAQERDANAHQCFAIACWAIGEIEQALAELDEATHQLRMRPGRHFSAWSYLSVPPQKFMMEIAELRLMVLGDGSRPAFMAQNVREKANLH